MVTNKSYVQGVPKNVLIECCWSHGAQAQSPVVGTSGAWKVFFFMLFLTKTKQDQVPPVMNMVTFSSTEYLL